MWDQSGKIHLVTTLKFRESTHIDKQAISFLNLNSYSDRPVFTPEKQIYSIFASSEATYVKATDPSELQVSKL